MSFDFDFGTNSSAPSETPSFQDVVAYLHGVTDAVRALKRNARSLWPVGNDDAVTGHHPDSSAPHDETKSARLTLRHGATEIELEGVLVVAPTASPFHAPRLRGGSRLIDLDGASTTEGEAHPAPRGTLPYWAPAVSLVPARPHAGRTERPEDSGDLSTSLPYSALALSLVPIAPAVPSGWVEEGGEERVSAVRLRAALPSAELYALTGTDDWDI